jgi:hypothetical protein
MQAPTRTPQSEQAHAIRRAVRVGRCYECSEGAYEMPMIKPSLD